MGGSLVAVERLAHLRDVRGRAVHADHVVQLRGPLLQALAHAVHDVPHDRAPRLPHAEVPARGVGELAHLLAGDGGPALEGSELLVQLLQAAPVRGDLSLVFALAQEAVVVVDALPVRHDLRVELPHTLLELLDLLTLLLHLFLVQALKQVLVIVVQFAGLADLLVYNCPLAHEGGESLFYLAL